MPPGLGRYLLAYISPSGHHVIAITHRRVCGRPAAPAGFLWAPPRCRPPAMPARTIDPKHWRDRAAFMRALSETTVDAEAKAIMLRLANDYDKLADRGIWLTDSEAPKKKRPVRLAGRRPPA